MIIFRLHEPSDLVAVRHALIRIGQGAQSDTSAHALLTRVFRLPQIVLQQRLTRSRVQIGADGRVRALEALPFGLRRVLAALVVTKFISAPLTTLNRRLLVLQSRARAAQVNIAWVSTLGGGHFLCRHAAQAVALARLQTRIACAAGDASAARRARLHLVYIAALAGRWRLGRRLLAAEWRAARSQQVAGTDDDGFKSMVQAARVYLRRTRALAVAGMLREPPSDASDDLHRQRLVSYNGTLTP